MSSLKSVQIHGVLPIECAKHYGIKMMLADLSAPGFGLSITYRSIRWSLPPNGMPLSKKVADFTISGKEEVKVEYIEKYLLQPIVNCGGEIESVLVLDEDNLKKFGDIRPLEVRIPEPKVNGYVYCVGVESNGKVDHDEFNYAMGNFMRDVIAKGKEKLLQKDSRPVILLGSTIFSETMWSVRPL